MRAEELDDSLLVLQARHEHVEVHPVNPLDRQPDMTADDLGHALCYHLPGSGRAGFASRRRLDRTSVLETGLTRARHEPAIGATKSTRLVGLRRSLVRFRDWAGDHTSFPREITEAALAHVIKDKAEAAYRRGTALEKRRKMLMAWQQFLGTGNNVVRLAR